MKPLDRRRQGALRVAVSEQGNEALDQHEVDIAMQVGNFLLFSRRVWCPVLGRRRQVDSQLSFLRVQRLDTQRNRPEAQHLTHRDCAVLDAPIADPGTVGAALILDLQTTRGHL